jgi:hypothetical protein
MADSEKKIDEMRDMLHELKPVVLDIREGQKAIDIRMRAVEVLGAAHTVKIDRIQTDMDGLGRKVRSIETRPPSGPPAPAPGRWDSMVDFLAAVPAYWHVAAYAVTALIAFVAILRKP